MAKYLTLSGLQTFYAGIKTKLDTKVDKVTGWGLSQNDLTDELKAQYDQAEKNVIVTVKVNGSALTPDSDRAVDVTVPTGALASLDEVAEENLAAELAAKINGKADAATTLEGYGITDTYTKTETDAAIGAAIGSTYKIKGSVAFASLPELTAVSDGWVYNVTDGFTTTEDFIEGASVVYPAGSNIVAVNVGTDEEPAYKWDVLAGTYDLSIYAKKEDIVAITTEEINNILEGKNPDGTEIA